MFGIAGIIGKLFGTDKAASSLIDNTSKMFDKLVYTREEKAEDKAKDLTEARTMIVNWLAATSGQNLSRRLIALTVTAMWVFSKVFFLSISIIVVWIVDPVKVQKLNETLTIIGDNTQDITSAMMLVLGFYFAAPYMGNIAKTALERFGNNSPNK